MPITTSSFSGIPIMLSICQTFIPGLFLAVRHEILHVHPGSFGIVGAVSDGHIRFSLDPGCIFLRPYLTDLLQGFTGSNINVPRLVVLPGFLKDLR